MTRPTFVLLAALAALVAIAPLAHAQNPHRMGMDPNAMMRQMQNPAAMQEMTAKAEAAERCMADIQKEEMEALERKAKSASEEIERLCKAGNKKAALAKGMALSREMNQDKTVLKIRECTKDLNAMMQGMMPMAGFANDDEPTDDDICS